MSSVIPLPIALALAFAILIGFVIGYYLGHRDGMRDICKLLDEIDHDKTLLRKFWDKWTVSGQRKVK